MQRHRKTRKRFEHPNEARFITFSCYQRLPLFTNDAIKDSFVDHLALSRSRLEFMLCAWVVMPEHVHLIVVPRSPALTMSRILTAIKRPFAARVLSRWRSLNAPILDRLIDSSGQTRFWQQGGGYDRNLVARAEFFEKVAYCHSNPVTRELVGNALEWPWSSARWYAGEREGTLPIDIMPW